MLPVAVNTAEREPEIPPVAVGEFQAWSLRGALLRGEIDLAEFERRVGFLVLADDWGWDG